MWINVTEKEVLKQLSKAVLQLMLSVTEYSYRRSRIKLFR